MTVLTLPFITTKSDNVRLVNDVDQPKLLARLLDPSKMDVNSSTYVRDMFTRCVCMIVLATSVLLGALLAILVVLNKAFYGNLAEANIQSQWYAIPCKSYTSYADAENDMLSMPSSPASTADSDYEVSQFDFMEVMFKNLENVALKPKENSDDMISTFNDSQDLDSVGTISSNLVINPTRFIHDFSINITGVIDVEGKRCYVMPLLPGMVSPPRSMSELLFKMSTGYYSTDVKKLIAEMPVLKPALKDLSDYGLYISKDCADYTTYKLDTTGLTTTDIAFV